MDKAQFRKAAREVMVFVGRPQFADEIEAQLSAADAAVASARAERDALKVRVFELEAQIAGAIPSAPAVIAPTFAAGVPLAVGDPIVMGGKPAVVVSAGTIGSSEGMISPAAPVAPAPSAAPAAAGPVPDAAPSPAVVP